MEYENIDAYLRAKENRQLSKGLFVSPPVAQSPIDQLRTWLNQFWEKLKAGDVASWIIVVLLVILFMRWI